MYVSVWESYLPPLIRWAIVGGLILSLSWIINTGLQKLGVKQEYARGYAFITPWILGLLIWTLFPFVTSLLLSFTNYNFFQPPEFVGVANYVEMFTEDRGFWPSVNLTLQYALWSVPLGLLGALGIALLLNRKIHFIGGWRTLYYLPAVLPAAATALLWSWMFSPSGLINELLAPIYNLLNVEPLQWFTDPDLVLQSYVIMGLWGIFGANAVILLAGLKNVPQDLYEASAIDGAGTFAKFWNITVPMLSPTLFYVLITGIIGALQIFTQAFFITTPRSAGQFLSVLIYDNAFAFRRFGYAAAMSWFMAIIIMIFTLIVVRWSDAWVFYETEQK
jgi:multiple sugar transport system permease protein